MKEVGKEKKKTVEIQYHKLTVMNGNTLERPIWRGVIIFAFGPYGTLFTDTYMGKRGAEMAVERFCSVVLGPDWEIKQ